MDFLLRPWHVMLLAIAGYLRQEQQLELEYLQCELSVLKELLGQKRYRLNDTQRIKLAVAGKRLGRNRLLEIGTLFTPDTILRWHRQLVARKWDYSQNRMPGRPRIRQVIVDAIVKFANENRNWGCDRIQGALANIGFHISDTTVANVLKQHGIEPAPRRGRTGRWKEFLQAHWNVLFATDFTTVEVWTLGGLKTYYLLFALELATRRVHFAGCTQHPNEQWMLQQARNLTSCDDGFLQSGDRDHDLETKNRILLMDRDPKFTIEFRTVLLLSGTKSLRLPSRSPNMNAYMERFFGSLKRECLDRLILFGERSLRNAVREYLAHYHTERNHQGLGNGLIEPITTPEIIPPDRIESIVSHERLGGLLRSYSIAA